MTSNCAFCGKELTHVPGRRKKQFCGDTCRSNHWNKAKREASKQPNNLIPVIKPRPVITPIIEKQATLIGQKIDIKIMPKGLSLNEQIQWKIDNA